jgi:hypothetical protein
MIDRTCNELCDPCNRILSQIRNVDWHTNLAHHASIETLRKSAKEACGVCYALLEHLETSAFAQEDDFWDRLFPILCECDTSSAKWQSSIELKLTSDGVENLNVIFTFEGIDDLGSP